MSRFRLLRDPGREKVCGGEYDWVACESRDLPALVRVHSTPCTCEEATALLSELARQHLPTAEANAFRVQWGSKRGRGGYLALRKREVRFVCPVTGRAHYRMSKIGQVPYVSLPKIPMKQGGPWKDSLRVGLVLHEFAHVLTIDNDQWHGKVFTKSLDDLVAAWIARQTRSLASTDRGECTTGRDGS